MKKIFTLVLMAVVAISASATQKRIAYVSDTTRVRDAAIRAELAKTYTIVDVLGTQTAAVVKAACEADTIDMVLFAEPLNSTATGVLGMQGVNKPLLNMKVFAYKKNAAAWSLSASTLWGENTTATALDIESGQSSHAIFTGLSSPISVLSAVGSSKGLDSTAINSLFTGTVTTLAKISSTTNICILEIAAGTTYSNVTTSTTVTIPKTYIQFGINTLSQNNLTTEGLKLIVNICDYLTSGTSGIAEQKAIDFKAIGGNGRITVELPVAGTVEVINIDGTSIAKKAITNEASISVPQGIYIVRVESGATVTAKKVIVK